MYTKKEKRNKIWKATMVRARALARKAKSHSEHVVVNFAGKWLLGRQRREGDERLTLKTLPISRLITQHIR